MEDLNHDEETLALFNTLQASVNAACKPNRQFRAISVVLVDEAGNAVELRYNAPGYLNDLLIWVHVMHHRLTTLVANMKDEEDAPYDPR